MRVRATGAPRAHPHEVVGHGRRSLEFLGFLVNSETVFGFTARLWNLCCCAVKHKRTHAPGPQAQEPLSLWTEVWPTQP